LVELPKDTKGTYLLYKRSGYRVRSKGGYKEMSKENVFDLENVSTDLLLMLSADTASLMSGSTRDDSFMYWYQFHNLIESHIDKRIAEESQKEECK